MVKFFLTKSSSETKKLGEILAKEVLRGSFLKKAFVLGLEGDLGGGKTTFLKGFAKGLGIKEKILSPTFVIMKKISIPSKKFENFYHFDCYRIKNEKEILDLGFNNLILNSRNIIAIEWAEKLKGIIPKNSLKIVFKFIGKNKREIKFKKYG
jgi:tRNA threonylcarbamoyladenosine biosynthesis protein TsaE